MIVRTALYTKYRPFRFEDVIGQDVFVKFFKNALQKNIHPQSGWLIYGSFGSGKTTMARIYAKAVLCENRGEDQNPCNVCESCSAINAGNNPNYLEIDSASYSGVKDVESVLSDCLFLPSEGKTHRIVVLDECHRISSAGQSLLLKTLEEGIPHVIFILLTTKFDKMLPALRSRLPKVQVSTCSKDQISLLLERVSLAENFEYDKDSLDLIAVKSKGHARDALTYLDQISCAGPVTKDFVNLFFLNDKLLKVCEYVEHLGQDIKKSLDILDQLSQQMGIEDLKSSILEVLNSASKYKVLNPPENPSEEEAYYVHLYSLYGDGLFNMFHFVNQQETPDYFAFENLSLILNSYTKSNLVYSAKNHVDTGKTSLARDVRRKSFRKSTNAVTKQELITPAQFAKIIGAEVV